MLIPVFLLTPAQTEPRSGHCRVAVYTPIRCSLAPPTGSVVTTPACTFAPEVSFMYAPGARVVPDSSFNPVLARTPGAQSHATPAPTIRFQRVRYSNWKILRSFGVATASAAAVPVQASDLRACVQAFALYGYFQPVCSEVLQDYL